MSGFSWHAFPGTAAFTDLRMMSSVQYGLPGSVCELCTSCVAGICPVDREDNVPVHTHSRHCDTLPAATQHYCAVGRCVHGTPSVKSTH